MNRERCNGFKPGINQERLTLKNSDQTGKMQEHFRVNIN